MDFLDINQPMSREPLRVSLLILLLRGARSLSGRDVETGKYIGSEFNEPNFINGTYQSLQFTGIINYLILLEQIGSIFEPKNKEAIKRKNEICLALTYFSRLRGKEKEILAIYNLRNSLVHKFGLATCSKDDSFKFMFSQQRNSNVVELGVWNGDFSNKSDTTLTTIFIHDLADLIEDVYNEICAAWEVDKLKMKYSEKMDEFFSRFTITS